MSSRSLRRLGGGAVLVLLSLAGFYVRVRPFLRWGAWGQYVDYDEGVYYSAAALLWRGIRPYRDFIFVHPPGLLEFLALSSAWVPDPTAGFALSRWIAAALGAGSIACLGWTLKHRVGWVAAVSGMAIYALFPEAVGTERGPFLESLLNFCCLLGASLWLASGNPRGFGARRAALAGFVFGLAVAVKLWAGIWMVAALLSLPKETSARDVFIFLGVAVAGFLALVAPIAWAGGAEFFRQTVGFHLVRPPDGANRAARLISIFNAKHLLPSLLLGWILFCALRTPWRGREEVRFFGVAFGLLLLVFLASPVYFVQYNAHLAAPWAALAGLGTHHLWNTVKGRSNSLKALAASLWFIAFYPQIRKTLVNAFQPSGLSLLKNKLATLLQPQTCVFSFEPAWALAAGRLPQVARGSATVDSYATLLMLAQRDGPFPNVSTAMRDDFAQGALRKTLDGCQVVLVGERARWEMSASTWAWFTEHFRRTWSTPPCPAEVWQGEGARVEAGGRAIPRSPSNS